MTIFDGGSQETPAAIKKGCPNLDSLLISNKKYLFR